MGESFFETQNRLIAKRAAAVAPAATGGNTQTPLTISQLTQQIERAVKSGIASNLLVQGQLSNYRVQPSASAHYFTLKDANACIDCVMWKEAVARLQYKPQVGMELLARGRVGVYGKQGKYQLYVDTLSPLGQGALEIAFQQMRARLEREGLFAPERKKPLPRYPMRIALVTSASTAALQDMLKVLRRYRWLRLYLYHAPVQGDGAAEKIVAALRHLSAMHHTIGGIDVILLGRGGGSLEDLWAFNEECVARAVAESQIPIVTGIGHEVDRSIADLIADHHAHTPTEAAQTIVLQWRQAGDDIAMTGTRLRRALRQRAIESRRRLTSVERHEVFRRPMDRINTLRQFLDDRERSLTLAVATRLRRCAAIVARLEAKLSERHPRHSIALRRARLDGMHKSIGRATRDHLRRYAEKIDSLQSHLRAVGPDEVLKRGYTITTRKGGSPLRSAADIKRGETLITRFADGTIESIAEDSRQPKLF